MTYIKWIGLGYLCILLISFGYSYAKASQTKEDPIGHNWATTRRDSASLAPDPIKFRNTAIVQIYTAPTYGWRGLFAVHPWIIFKRVGKHSTPAMTLLAGAVEMLYAKIMLCPMAIGSVLNLEFWLTIVGRRPRQ